MLAGYCQPCVTDADCAPEPSYSSTPLCTNGSCSPVWCELGVFVSCAGTACETNNRCSCSPPPDAGPDAGPQDAGPEDAGPTDAGVPCLGVSDCTGAYAGDYCDNGQCVECLSDSNCGAFNTCDAGTCYDGVDAGPTCGLSGQLCCGPAETNPIPGDLGVGCNYPDTCGTYNSNAATCLSCGFAGQTCCPGSICYGATTCVSWVCQAP